MPGSGTTFPNGLLPVFVEAGATIVRVHLAENGPLWFGPAKGRPPAHRFDAVDGGYRVLYAAAALEGAFVESVLHRPAGRIVARAFLDRRVWSALRVGRRLRLAKLYDEGLLWHGTDASVSAVSDYGESRRIANALHAAFPDLDGIAYRARHDNGEICFALFDRVAPADLIPDSRHAFAEYPERVDGLMRRYGAVLDDSAPVPDPG